MQHILKKINHFFVRDNRSLLYYKYNSIIGFIISLVFMFFGIFFSVDTNMERPARATLILLTAFMGLISLLIGISHGKMFFIKKNGPKKNFF